MIVIVGVGLYIDLNRLFVLFLGQVCQKLEVSLFVRALSLGLIFGSLGDSDNKRSNITLPMLL